MLVAVPSMWLAASLAAFTQIAIALALHGPLVSLVPALTVHALPLMAVGVAAAVFGNLILGIEIMQNQRTFTLFLSSFLILIGTAAWLTGLQVHPEWLWSIGHWLGIPVAAVLMASPCGTAAVIRMLHTETILETLLVLLLFFALAAGAHWLVLSL